jgi:hypothetical protein
MTHLSRSLVIGAAVCTTVGLASGLSWYLNRDERVERHSPGTEAWIPHLIVLAVLVLWFLVASRRSPLGWKVILAPLARTTAARIGATFRTLNPLRWPAVALLLFVEAYTAWRVGEQVFAGLDPNFVHNAWGGPTYLGAMFCHYLDGALICAVCHTLLRRATVSDDPGRHLRAQV